MSRYVIGLTGGIACGKTNVTNALLSAGAYVVDADVVSRKLTEPGGTALPLIRAAFSDAVFDHDVLDRRRLAGIVFSDETQRAKLNDILHPLILSEMRALLDSHNDVAVLSAPLLYECRLDEWCDEVWCVYVPQKEQIRRLCKREKITQKEALARIHAQMPPSVKARSSDIVIRTDKKKEETAALAIALYAETLKRINETS